MLSFKVDMIMMALLSNSSSKIRTDSGLSSSFLLHLQGSSRGGVEILSALALSSCFLLDLFRIDLDLFLLFFLDHLDLESWETFWLLLLGLS
jgi:hypothetical protein